MAAKPLSFEGYITYQEYQGNLAAQSQDRVRRFGMNRAQHSPAHEVSRDIIRGRRQSHYGVPHE
jgi:hypothetical protein